MGHPGMGCAECSGAKARLVGNGCFRRAEALRSLRGYWSESGLAGFGVGAGVGFAATFIRGRLLRRKATRSLIWSSVNWLPKAGMASMSSWVWVAISLVGFGL